MRRKVRFLIFVPIIIAVMILSLSKEKNRELSNKVSHTAARFFSLFSSRSNQASVEEQKNSRFLTSWLQKTEEAKELYIQENGSLLKERQFLVGKVIFRSLNSWNSTLWIDVGSDNNPPGASPVIAKNSPVLSGSSVVGVVDYVGKKSSLVRLITDPQLFPAVRVSRGGAKYARELAIINELLLTASQDTPLFSSSAEQLQFTTLLQQLKRSIESLPTTKKLFAKGELQGSSEPQLRSRKVSLKGVGFNYDFPDSAGEAKPLRSKASGEPLLQAGDLLVTSGLDGIFPEGLPIAIVETITPLREGAYAYELTAKPTALHLLDLSYVSIIAPQVYDDRSIPFSSAILPQ